MSDGLNRLRSNTAAGERVGRRFVRSQKHRRIPGHKPGAATRRSDRNMDMTKSKHSKASQPSADRAVVTRRGFIKSSTTLLGITLMGTLAACGGGESSSPPSPSPSSRNPSPANRVLSYLLPGEDLPHTATYMAFASGSEGIWTPVTVQSTDAGIDRVRADLLDVAKAIGTYEPVNMLVLPVDLSVAQTLLATAILTESAVLHVNRNPQLFAIPNGVVANATLLPTAKDTVLAELQRTLGVQKIIWIPGTTIYPQGCGAGGQGGAATPANETDITNGHVDFYAKFLAPGVVAYAADPSNSTYEQALMAANYRNLVGQTDAKGRPLTLIALNAPGNYGTSNGVTLSDKQMTNFAAGYINFYKCNGAIIVPKFNDLAADAAAVATIRAYAGSRAIVQVDILGIASGGGGVHCATRELPA